jgi:hypothetical protein
MNLMKNLIALIILALVGCGGEKIYKRKDDYGNTRLLKVKITDRKLSAISSYENDKTQPIFFEINDCIVFDKSNWKCGNIHLVNDELFIIELGVKYVYK